MMDGKDIPTQMTTPAEALIGKAAWTFRESPRILKALRTVKENPQALDHRLIEFDHLIVTLNQLFNQTLDKDQYQHVIKLKAQLNNQKIPSLFNTHLRVYQSGNGILQDVLAVFKETKQWAWLEEVPNDYQLISGLLIEGFGSFLSKQHQNDESIQRNFVLAFEEVGLFNHPSSHIMKDVFPWLIEEKTAFPLKAQKQIDQLTSDSA